MGSESQRQGKNMANFKVIRLSESPKVPFSLDGRILFTSPELELVHLTLRPGERLDPHIQPFDVLFYVIDGEGELTVEDGSIKAAPGTLIEVKKGTSRRWINQGKDSLRMIVLKRIKI